MVFESTISEQRKVVHMASLVKSFDSEENLETFSLLWLDASVNNCQENVDAQHQLRTSINFLRTFEEVDQCEAYIRSKSKDDRIILITSGRLGQIIVPQIHSLRTLSSIYVYCKDKKLNEAWANQYKKVSSFPMIAVDWSMDCLGARSDCFIE